MLCGLREKNNPLTFATFIPINNISIRRKDGSRVKNQSFNTEILRNMNTYEHDTGDFFLKKDIVAFPFDSVIDRVILLGYHGAVEVLEDEFYIDFEIINKTDINQNKSYEIVIMMYMPKLLRINGSSKDIEIKF